MPRNQKSASNDSSQLSVRCDAELKQQYADVLDDEGRNMSDDLREHMEAVVSRNGGTTNRDDELPADEMLRQSYYVLDEYADPDTRLIDVEAAETILADKTNTPKKVVRNRIIKPLDERGLIKPNWGSIIVSNLN